MFSLFLALVFSGITLSYGGAQNQGDTTQANQHYQQADSLAKLGEYRHSTTRYQQAGHLYRRAARWERYVSSLNQVAYNMCKTSPVDSVRAVAQQAGQASRRYLGAKHVETGRSYVILGEIARNQGDYRQALTYGQQALQILQRDDASQPLVLADVYEHMGLVYVGTAQYDSAMYFSKQGLALRSRGGERPLKVAISYDNIGNVYHHQGENDRALSYYQRALTIVRESGEEHHPYLAEIYSHLGSIHRDKGLYDQALLYNLKALAFFEKWRGVHPDVALAYNNLGLTYRAKGLYNQALKCHRRAIKIQQQWFDVDHPDMVKSYNNLGTVYRERAVYDSALLCHQRALKILQGYSPEEHTRRAITLTRIGRVHHQQKEYVRALSAYRDALLANGASFADTSLYANPGIKRYLHGMQMLYTLEAKAKTLTALGLPAVAYDTYQLTDSLLTHLSQSYATQADKVTLASIAKRLRERGIQTALERYESTHDQQYLQTAFRFCEQSKAGVLTEALSTLEAQRFGQVPDSLLMIEASLKAERSFYRSQLNGADSSYYKRSLFAVDRRYDSLIQVLESQFPDYFQLKYAAHTATVASVQSKLSPDEVMVSYFMGDSARYAFAVTAATCQVYTLSSDTVLDAQLSALHQVLRSDQATIDDFQQPAHALYEQLLAPVLEDHQLAGIKRLTIIQDGVLSYLPFDLLLATVPTQETSYANLPYLVRDYTIRYGYSATWLFYPFSRAKRSVLNQYVAFAPAYLYDVPNQTLPKLAEGRFSRTLAPLRYNRQEAKNIRQYLPGVTYTDGNATEQNFKEEAQHYRVIHLAMHAQVDDKNPMNSRLVFSAPKQGQQQDGYLNAYELYDMNLSADLTVLSACETGYGKLERGEGVMSLARAFAYAGCPSIIMSHWLVDDATSAQLMDYFYRFLSEGMPKDEALRRAKLSYLETTSIQKAHPYFWSNFVLIGDDKPVGHSPIAIEQWGYAFGGIFLLIGLIVGVYRFLPSCRTSEQHHRFSEELIPS